MELPLDKYSYQARLLPTLIAFVPAGFAFGAWSLNEAVVWKSSVAVVASLLFASLLAQLGRDLGKRKEPVLFAQWGGKPTTRLLSHRFSSLNAATLKRHHSKLKVLLPDLAIPEPAQEMKSPSEATQVYESCAMFLRENTRDREKFPLVFAENVNYGFRRNLWAWKPFGIIAASVGVASAVVFAVVRRSGGRSELIFSLVSGAASLVLLLLWLFVIKPSWVRVTAEAYAERLIGSLDSFQIARD